MTDDGWSKRRTKRSFGLRGSVHSLDVEHMIGSSFQPSVDGQGDCEEEFWWNRRMA